MRVLTKDEAAWGNWLGTLTLQQQLLQGTLGGAGMAAYCAGAAAARAERPLVDEDPRWARAREMVMELAALEEERRGRRKAKPEDRLKVVIEEAVRNLTEPEKWVWDKAVTAERARIEAALREGLEEKWSVGAYYNAPYEPVYSIEKDDLIDLIRRVCAGKE